MVSHDSTIEQAYTVEKNPPDDYVPVWERNVNWTPDDGGDEQ